MRHATWAYCAALAAVMLSFSGFVLLPHARVRDTTVISDELGDSYPVDPGGRVEMGRQVYAGLGCIYCHSQQVRAAGFGSDMERGWGRRRSVPRDYLLDRPALLGTMRTGPDLTNIGLRQPSPRWHYLHLYQPRQTSPDSIMPPHPFLFDRRSASPLQPPSALQLPAAQDDSEDVLVPNADAEALVAYLLSLQRDRSLPEAP